MSVLLSEYSDTLNLWNSVAVLTGSRKEQSVQQEEITHTLEIHIMLYPDIMCAVASCSKHV